MQGVDTAQQPLAVRPREAAQLLSISPRFLWQLTKDGAYNTHYDNNYASIYEQYSYNPTAGNGTSRAQAQQVCNNMKAAGVQVFSVGVELGNDTDSKNALLACVSSADNLFSVHYYDVLSAIASQTGLVAAFNDIGTKLAAATGTGNHRTRLTQ